jgi:MFS family permease
VFGAALVSNSPGTVVDISDEDNRALVMSLWSIAPLNGPVTGPVIGGFVFQYMGWRWDNWIVLIIAGVACVMMTTLRETYAPAILQRKAARLRKEMDDPRWWCRYDQRISKLQLIKINLGRPFVLSLTEPILWFFNLWYACCSFLLRVSRRRVRMLTATRISLIYGILYLCFVAYPIVFSQHRGWAPGTSGLAFVGIGVGTLLGIAAEPLLRRMINAHPKDPATGRVPPEASASAMIIGAVATPIGQIAFAWTCLPGSIHWAIPIAFGVPFGFGNTLSFIYGANYLAGAYGIYAASALAGNAVVRSFFGGTLPLAGPAMYRNLTPQWAGTLLGLLEAAMIPIPVIFYKYGERIRAKSKIIRQLREDQEKNEGRQARRRRVLERNGGGDGVAGASGVLEKETGGLGSAADAKPKNGPDRDVEKATGLGIVKDETAP